MCKIFMVGHWATIDQINSATFYSFFFATSLDAQQKHSYSNRKPLTKNIMNIKQTAFQSSSNNDEAKGHIPT